MTAEIIAVGSELLTPQRVDTNSLFLTDQLNELGVEVVTKSVIGDDMNRLADAVRRAVSRSEIVRAAIAGLRELHRLAPASLSRLVPLLPLSSCTGAGLGQMAVLAMRLATRGAPTKSRAPHQAGSAANHDSRVLHGGDAAEKQRVIAGRKQTGMDSFDG